MMRIHECLWWSRLYCGDYETCCHDPYDACEYELCGSCGRIVVAMKLVVMNPLVKQIEIQVLEIY